LVCPSPWPSSKICQQQLHNLCYFPQNSFFELLTLTINAVWHFKISGTCYPVTQWHMPYVLDHHIQRFLWKQRDAAYSSNDMSRHSWTHTYVEDVMVVRSVPTVFMTLRPHTQSPTEMPRPP
jgi:hypothetical protein